MHFSKKQQSAYLNLFKSSDVLVTCAELKDASREHKNRVKYLFTEKLKSICILASTRDYKTTPNAHDVFYEEETIIFAVKHVTLITLKSRTEEIALGQAHVLLKYYLIAIFFQHQALSSTKGIRFKNKRVKHAQETDDMIREALELSNETYLYDFKKLDSLIEITPA